MSLNPYCAGSRSLTMCKDYTERKLKISLNPYCAGSRSLTMVQLLLFQIVLSVLILIVLEVGL